MNNTGKQKFEYQYRLNCKDDWKKCLNNIFDIHIANPYLQIQKVTIPSEHLSKEKKEETQEELWYEVRGLIEKGEIRMQELTDQYFIQRKQ